MGKLDPYIQNSCTLKTEYNITSFTQNNRAVDSIFMGNFYNVQKKEQRTEKHVKYMCTGLDTKK